MSPGVQALALLLELDQKRSRRHAWGITSFLIVFVASWLIGIRPEICFWIAAIWALAQMMFSVVSGSKCELLLNELASTDPEGYNWAKAIVKEIRQKKHMDRVQ